MSDHPLPADADASVGPPLADEDFARLARWAADHMGARIAPDQRERLRQRLEPMRAELVDASSWKDLYRRLRIGHDRDRLAADAVRRLTNKESYFFRERAHLALLVEEVLPARLRVMRQEGRKELRVLSAGCGQGQEPYSVAMAVADSGRLPPGYRLDILAVDVDVAALEAARAGVYTAHSLRGVAEDARERFFRRVDRGRFEIRPAFRRDVTFRQANLAGAHWERDVPSQDVAFCRNVLIYLNEQAQAEAIRSLYRVLAPGGYLFVGHVEHLRAAAGLFEVHRRTDATCYRKPAE
ncbi:MAG TPA: protein-glutamate O-methyltransferase CheR [Longimicrobiales bacterium]|nr:protein-glutamate O-methyltransferase CheR [Longimicrobiales bacterium]